MEGGGIFQKMRRGWGDNRDRRRSWSAGANRDGQAVLGCGSGNGRERDPNLHAGSHRLFLLNAWREWGRAERKAALTSSSSSGHEVGRWQGDGDVGRIGEGSGGMWAGRDRMEREALNPGVRCVGAACLQCCSGRF